MKNMSKILFFLIVVGTMSFTSVDDRGGKKGAKKVLLNISNDVARKNNIFSQNFGAVQYKGLSFGSATGNTISVGSSIFQKGNTIYIQPVKERILVPEFKQGYSGLKLIISVR